MSFTFENKIPKMWNSSTQHQCNALVTNAIDAYTAHCNLCEAKEINLNFSMLILCLLLLQYINIIQLFFFEYLKKESLF